ncbi:hypothetical protein CNR22_12355 [Sphingobacteriaceae bacterium]|nr:hypothetical protein CNR22_12355 [Sphingobacteriaceae bacterium]
MRFFIFYIFFSSAILMKAQSPFISFRTSFQNDDYKSSQRVLDSCSFAKYEMDSVLYYKGLLTLKKGNIKGARLLAKDIQNTYPSFNEVHYLNALIYFNQEDYGNSIDEFTVLIMQNPQHMKARYNRSIAHGLLDNYLSAIDDLSACITVDSSFAMGYYSRAYWYEFSGNYEEAKKDYEQSIKLDPKNYDAYFGLAYIYQNQKERTKACETIRSAVSAGSQIAEELSENFCR